MKKRSKFNLSHYKLFSCNMGSLVPIGLTEVIPGDTFQHAVSALIRCSPLLSPVMHPVHVKIHHFFVPHRLVWEDFESFITGGENGMDASVFPTITMPNSTGAAVGSLADHLGVPPEVADLEVSALPFRAYQLIFNEFYRDQDLINAVTIDKSSGADTTTNTSLQNVAWEKDYFTTARPWTQKGPEITIPLGTDAPVLGLGLGASNAYNVAGASVRESDASSSTYANSSRVDNSSVDTALWIEEDPDNDGYPRIRADLSNASAASINDLRRAFALQRFEEARAQYGGRYPEYLRYLGIRSSDARLQRPEYLGGGVNTIQFSEVLQTAEGTNPVGELRGHGIGALKSNRYRRFFEEHGYVISLMSVKPKTMYPQGLDRTWNRRTKEDFFQKELQHIGQQELLNKEVYAAHSSPNGTFGYNNRYEEYRRMNSKVAGQFRTSALDYWHMARIFTADPTLNESFVTSVPTERVFAVPSEDVLWVMARHKLIARRLVDRSSAGYIF